ncbi:MAG: helix-turn-helix domain-containing protein [Novosphingobium sp.]
MSPHCDVHVRFFPPPPDLRRYFTTFYLVECEVANGGVVRDYLLPEWANLRFHSGCLPVAESLSGARVAGTTFPVTGPSSRAVRFTIGSTRMWGIGLLPLGWAKFVGAAAGDFADGLLDGNTHPAFAAFRPLADYLMHSAGDVEAEQVRIADHFRDHLDVQVPEEERIVAIHAALVDPEIATVVQLAERAGIGQRTAERLCRRAFGFPPKLLLRRQRFIRSLSQFMLDPSLKWIGAMDGHYHDQSQFVRDCRQFMGMSPSQYGALPKPLIGAIMRERDRMAGSAAQTLDSPDGPKRPR